MKQFLRYLLLIVVMIGSQSVANAAGQSLLQSDLRKGASLPVAKGANINSVSDFAFTADNAGGKKLQRVAPKGSRALYATTFTFSEFGYENAQTVNGETFQADDVFLTFMQGSGSVDPKYYNLETSLRVYNGNEISIKTAGCNMVKVVFETGSYKFTKEPEIISGNGTFDVATQAWEGDSYELYMKVSEKVYIQKLTVFYETEDVVSDWQLVGNAPFKNQFTEVNGGEVWDVPCYYMTVNDNSRFGYVKPYGQPASFKDYYSVSPFGEIFDNAYFIQYKDEYYYLQQFDLGLTFTDKETEVQERYIAMSKAYFMARYLEGADGTLTDDLSSYAYLEDAFYFPTNSLVIVIVDLEGYILSANLVSDEVIFAGLPGFEYPKEGQVAETEIYIYGQGTGLSTAAGKGYAVKKSDDGTFSATIDNLEWFAVATEALTGNDTFTNCFSAQVYKSTLGKAVPVTYGNGYYTPWKGKYTITVSPDLSTITLATATAQPATLDLSLIDGTQKYAMTKVNATTYSYTATADITGAWGFATADGRYDYGYVGSANPRNQYLFPYGAQKTSLALGKGDKVTIVVDTDVYTNAASVTIERAEAEPEITPDPESETMNINGVEYTLYPSQGCFDATNGATAKNNVTLLETTTTKSGKELVFRGVAEGAFKGNDKIRGITLPDGATYIGKEAFADCENLETVEIPASVTSIGDYAFLNCSYIAEMVLPEGLKKIGTGVFSGCGDLESISINKTALTAIPDALFEDCGRLKEVKIPATVTKIGANAFFNSGVVTIGNSTKVTTIGDRAFEGSGLTQFDFDAVTEIGIAAFKMTSIKEARLPKTATKIGDEAFADCVLLSKLSLPEGLKAINASVFEGCAALHSVNLPAGLTTIGDNAFYNSGLVSIDVPEGVTELGANSLVCSSLMSVTLRGNIETLANMPLSTNGMLRLYAAEPPMLASSRLGCTPSVVVVPNGSGSKYKKSSRWKEYNIIEENGKGGTVYVQTPGSLATDIPTQLKAMPAEITYIVIKGELNDADLRVIRSNMTALIDLDLTDATLTELPADAFKGKTCITKIALPAGLTKIGDSAFEGCSLLSEIAIPAGVTEIGNKAFYGCGSIAGTVNIPANCTTIGMEAFANCYRIDGANIYGSKVVSILDGTFMNCINLDLVTLPVTIKSIGDNAFAHSGIATIEFPGTLEEIGESAFEGCSYLYSLEIPDTTTEIGARAFAKSGLLSLTMPANLKTVNDETFADCDNLMFVNLPGKLENLGNRALASHSLSAISAPVVTPPSTGFEPFQSVNNYTCALSIPGMSYNAYLSAQYWGAFVGISNSIDVTISGDVEVTYVDEEDYTELVAGGKIFAPGKRKAAAQTSPDNFASLFDGAQLFRADKTQTRFFFGDATNLRITYNGKDVSKEIDPKSQSWVCPEFNSSTSMRITADGAGISNVKAENVANNDVYDLTGRLIFSNASQENIRTLAPGIYVIGGKKQVIK